MKTFYATVTSPAVPQACIQGVITLFDDGTVVGGDSSTVWAGTQSADGTIDIAITEKIRGTAALSRATAKYVDGAPSLSGSGVVMNHPTYTGQTIPLVIGLELLK